MSTRIKITESMFNAIKLMLKGGASNVECARYMGISDSTVSIMRKSETYEEYKHNAYICSGTYKKKMAAIKSAEKAKEQEKEKQTDNKAEDENGNGIKKPETEYKQTIVVQASHYMLEEQKKTNELLTLISNKLAFIVDELTR